VINQTQEREEEAASLPRVLSLAVHELRTPVTVVAGYIRMLIREQGGPLTEKQRKMLEEADRSCARIAALVLEMSEFGKLESRELGLERLPFDLAALVAETAAGLGDDSRGVHVEPRGAERPVMVTGDRARIATAVRALIHAAVRERIEPGVVVAACSVVDTWGVVAVGDDASLPALVRSASEAPAGFDEWRGGMGLSLPVGKRVVESQDGAVWSIGDGPQRASGLRLPLVP
jgi:signal transduction histidine kinase